MENTPYTKAENQLDFWLCITYSHLEARNKPVPPIDSNTFFGFVDLIHKNFEKEEE